MSLAARRARREKIGTGTAQAWPGIGRDGA